MPHRGKTRAPQAPPLAEFQATRANQRFTAPQSEPVVLIDCRNIRYRYPNAEAEVFAGLSFCVRGPGFHALFGPSGVGKTTLARMIAGNGRRYEGRIETPGVARTLYSYNLERLPGWSCVGDHIAKVTPPSRRERMGDLIRSFGLEACMDARFSQLSLGQKNRANLTRYLVQDFDLLIMDESLANVDESTRERIILKIKRMFPEKGFLYISHNVAEVSKFCRQVVVLREAVKQPQAISIEGLDIAPDQPLDKSKLERAMLEIVHAA